MRKRSRDSWNGTLAPVLTAPTLSGIHDLNTSYLELLIADRDGQHVASSLPLAVITGLAELSASARRALAACPYALYSLGVEHPEFWRTTADNRKVAEEAPRYQLQRSLSAESCFGSNALFFAWHVANEKRIAAKVLFAMPEVVVAALARLQLWELQRVAFESHALKPRWPTNAGFWPDLVRFAARDDLERLNTTQLLGSQLIAAELRAFSATRSVMRGPLAASPGGASLPIP